MAGGILIRLSFPFAISQGKIMSESAFQAGGREGEMSGFLQVLVVTKHARNELRDRTEVLSPRCYLLSLLGCKFLKNW